MNEPTKPSLSGIRPDIPAIEDKLGFAPYANTLRDIILSDNTQTPLTIGIFGSWGSGKTSLMKMVEDGILKQGGQGNLRKTYSIWFNAWLYSKENALWHALVTQLLSKISREFAGDKKIISQLGDVEKQLNQAIRAPELGTFSITAQDLVNNPEKAEFSMNLQQGLDLLLGLKGDKEADAQNLAAELHKRVQTTAVELEKRRIESLQEFRDAFEKLMGLVRRKGYMVVFVDDLDRCLPDKAVEVLEAIKLFLDVPGCIFVLGIDKDVVERGIRLRYGEMGGDGGWNSLPFLLSSDMLSKKPQEYRDFLEQLINQEDIINGERYLEKIIQVPFSLPPISRIAMGRFVSQLSQITETKMVDGEPVLVDGKPVTEKVGDILPHPECAQVLALGLDTNPRQVIRALNIFMLLWTLAEKTPNLAIHISPIRLAKLVVLQQRHSDLYELLREEPDYLRQWEIFLRQKADPDILRDWEMRQDLPISEPVELDKVSPRDLDELRPVLLMHDLDHSLAQESNFVALTPAEMRTYVFLARTVEESVEQPQEPSGLESIGGVGNVVPVGQPGGTIAIGSALEASRIGYIQENTYSTLEKYAYIAFEGEQFPPDTRATILEQLAQLGSENYRQIIGSRMREQLDNAPEDLHILIDNATGAQIPWELMYDIQPDPSILAQENIAFSKMAQQSFAPNLPPVPVETMGFWGFKHILERPLDIYVPRRKGTGPPAPLLQRHFDRPPRVVLGIDYEVQNDEVMRSLEAWAGEGRIEYKIAEDVEFLANNPADIIIFRGQAGTTSGEIWLRLGKRQLYRRDFTYLSSNTSSPPAMVYLDVPASLGRLDEWPIWLGNFQSQGIEHVIAPTIAAHPSWTPYFFQFFFAAIWEGATIGQSIRDARRKLLESNGNPLGLFFSHFGPADTLFTFGWSGMETES